MALLLKNVRCVDPAVGLDGERDVLVRDGVIVETGEPGSVVLVKGVERDLAGKVLVPGLVDMHVHLREPGQEYKEDIASGGAAAARGGFTAVLAMPNTAPVCDSGSTVSYVLEKAHEATRTRVHVAGALTQGLKGEALSEMGDMVQAGAVAFTDDGRGVQDGGMMRRAMEYALPFAKPVLSHCQMEDLVGPGVVNEGAASTRLGMAGWPVVGEEVQIARDIALCALTGCALHIQHITTAAGVALVKAAREQGLPVSCEVTPHHLFLCEDDLDEGYDTNLKMNPPLRPRTDVEALQEALVAGDIDCIATDHAPHAPHEKALEFEAAPFGTTGLETALALVLTELVATGRLGWGALVERMAHAPRRILGLGPVTLAAGSVADLTVIDPAATWEVTARSFESKAGNSAFLGRVLTGRASDVFVGGYASLEEGKVVAGPFLPRTAR
ncbi:MAG: dihydroorotase [Coriobacteriales bacterium]|jgi:dihydroorotase|nr:dihydroorotase [Coriobacteriales bacterium]